MSKNMPLQRIKSLGFMVAIFGFSLFLDVRAEENGINLTKPLPPTQRVFIDNINLTVKDFFSAYMSKSIEERRYAELYLLGVMDATEGKSWCDYRTYKTITLGEEIFLGLKALDKSKQSERAAYVISNILSNKFPCRRKTR